MSFESGVRRVSVGLSQNFRRGVDRRLCFCLFCASKERLDGSSSILVIVLSQAGKDQNGNTLAASGSARSSVTQDEIVIRVLPEWLKESTRAPSHLASLLIPAGDAKMAVLAPGMASTAPPTTFLFLVVIITELNTEQMA